MSEEYSIVHILWKLLNLKTLFWYHIIMIFFVEEFKKLSTFALYKEQFQNDFELF